MSDQEVVEAEEIESGEAEDTTAYPPELVKLIEQKSQIEANTRLNAAERKKALRQIRRRIREVKTAHGIEYGSREPSDPNMTDEEREARKKARRAERRSARVQEYDAMGVAVQMDRDWRVEHAAFQELVNSIEPTFINLGLLYMDGDTLKTQPGMGFDIVQVFERRKTLDILLTKFEQRWMGAKPTWFGITMQGEVPILVLGHLPPVMTAQFPTPPTS